MVRTLPGMVSRDRINPAIATEIPVSAIRVNSTVLRLDRSSQLEPR